MEAFVRQSGGQPWIPFSQNLQSTDAVDREEHRVFNEMSAEYNRSVAPSAAHGYNAFALAWDQLVGDRYQKKLEEGDDSIVLLRPKSVTQLQSFYDYLQRLGGQANHSTEGIHETAQQLMHRALKDSRREMSGQVTTTPAAPIAYPTALPDAGQLIPLGAAVMQHSIFANSFLQVNQTAANYAPFALRDLPPAPPPPKRSRTANSRNQTCQICGHPKKDHLSAGQSILFGKGRCNLITCGVCYREKKEHDSAARASGKPVGTSYSWMGENCIFQNQV